MILLYFVGNVFGKCFKLDSSLDFKNSILNYFPSYYQKVFRNWKSVFIASTIVISCIPNKFLWYNRYNKIDNDVVFFEIFSENGINFLMQLFDENRVIIKWCLLTKGRV